MNRTWRNWLIGTSLALFVGASSLGAAQESEPAPGPIGMARVTHAVVADGKSLAAGTYQVRLTGDPTTPVVGQGPQAERWVEFVRNGTVAGRELATVVAAADIGKIAKEAPPAMGTTRVEPLVGGEYLRVWIASKGHHFIINLTLAK